MLLSRGIRNFLTKKSIRGHNIFRHNYGTRSHVNSLEIQWNASESMKFNKKWLRSCCPCHECKEEFSHQKLFLTSDIPDDVSVKRYKINEDNTATIYWDDGHESKFSHHWLSNYTESALDNELERIRPTYWNGERMENIGGIPAYKYSDFIDHEEALYHVMKSLNELGVVKLKGCSTEELTVVQCAERISYLRETMYGRYFDVISKPSANNIAYTSKSLPLHQDLCYYESPPGLQYLHCLHFDQKEGGDNLFADGFYLASILKERDPKAFKTLSTMKTTFHKLGEDHSMIYRRSIIDVNEKDEPIGLYWSPPFEGPMLYSGDILDEYYRAYKVFKQIIDEREHQVQNRFEVGDIVIFNNRRTLHARTSYNENDGIRHLQGTYTETDEFLNRYRVLMRKYGQKGDIPKLSGIRSY